MTFSDTPEVLAALHDAAVGGLDVLSRADDREGHSLGKDASVLCTSLIIHFNGWLVDTNILSGNNVPDLPLPSGHVRCLDNVKSR